MKNTLLPSMGEIYQSKGTYDVVLVTSVEEHDRGENVIDASHVKLLFPDGKMISYFTVSGGWLDRFKDLNPTDV